MGRNTGWTQRRLDSAPNAWPDACVLRLRNETAACADLIRSVYDGDRNLAALIARASFRIEDDALVPITGGAWPVNGAPHPSPFGEVPGDLPFLTGGVDVMVAGSAHAPGGEPVERLSVELRVGTRFSRRLEVFGDRHWQLEGERLIASEPRPFTSMPLTFARAFGGEAESDGGIKLTWPANPGGRGFYLTADEAAGRPLPNLEDPSDRISTWTDRVEPLAFDRYPADGSLRVMNAVDVHHDLRVPENSHIERVKPLMFNLAHPKLIIEPKRAPTAGDWVEISHLRPNGALRFRMPDFALHAHLQLEERSHMYPLHLDTLAIEADAGVVHLGYRVVFRYRLRRLERRGITLYSGACPGEVPEAYVTAWDAR